MSTSVPGGYDAGAPSTDSASLGDLLANVTSDLTTLIRQEMELAKAEAKQSATKAGKGAGMVAGAGIAAHLMLIFLSLALVYLLGEVFGLGLGWGALIVGLLWGIIAAVLALRGKREFQGLGMQQTVETAARIPDALTGNETTTRREEIR